MVIDALQRRIVSFDALWEHCVRMPRSVARTGLRQVVSELSASRVDSPFEWQVAAAVRERGLEPVTGFPWRCPDRR